MPRYLLRLRKTSCLLIDRNLAIWVGSSKASSKAKASIASREIPDGCIIPQGLTIEHWSWKPGLRLRWLIVFPLWASLPCLSSLLLLCNPLGLFFRRRARSPSLQYLLALLLSLFLWVNRFKSGWQRWLWRRKRKRKFGRRRRKFGLSWFPRRILSGLGLY